ncbi:MAG: hypothetical protein FWD26_03625 [Treponema sp.]|nr:hypothetical protein [Treponema sp.]
MKLKERIRTTSLRSQRLCVSAKVSLQILLLAAIVLLAGCENGGEDGDFVLEGVWIGTGDYYIITAGSVFHIMEGGEWDGFPFPDMVLIGDIKEIIEFSDNAGVLIIKITYAAPDFTDYNVGKYTGIYYRDGSYSSIRMGNAYLLEDPYFPIEKDSIEDARLSFTAGNAQTHIGVWGLYTK